jgi:cytidylate kinase
MTRPIAVAARSWTVRQSHFPFVIPGKVLARITARDRDDAARQAADLFPGKAVTVEPSPANPDRLERALEQIERHQRRTAAHRRRFPTT